MNLHFFQKLQTTALPDNEESTPWYIIVLQLFGATGAAAFFMLFLLLFELLNSRASLLIVGPITMLTSLLLNLKHEKSYSFFKSLLLVFFIIGQVLFFSGLFFDNFSFTVYNWVVIVTQPIFILLFISRFYAYPSLFVFLAAIISEIFRLKWHEVLPIFFMALTVALFFLFENRIKILSLFSRWVEDKQNKNFVARKIHTMAHLQTIFSSLLYILPLFLLFSHFYDVESLRDSMQIHSWVAYVTLLGVSLAWLCHYLLSVNEIEISVKAKIIGIIFIAAFTVVSIKVSGIIGALLLLIYGWHRLWLYLQVLSLGFLIYFISYFYYSLKLSLLYKSILLMGMGLLFFVGLLILQKMSKRSITTVEESIP